MSNKNVGEQQIESSIRTRNSERNENVPIAVDFEWEVEPLDNWAGFSRRELIELVTEAADFFHIPPEKRSKMRVVFGDHESIVLQDGEQRTDSAISAPFFDENKKVKESDIVINRSRELAIAHRLGKLANEGKTDQEDFKIENGCIEYVLKEPWESIVRLIAEEANHSAYDLQLEDYFKIVASKKRYQKKAMMYHQNELKNDRIFHEDSLDISEIAASRQVLRFLEHVALQKSPQRAPFFRMLYELSLKERKVVLASHDVGKNSAFISTGYQPHEDMRKIEHYLPGFFETV